MTKRHLLATCTGTFVAICGGAYGIATLVDRGDSRPIAGLERVEATTGSGAPAADTQIAFWQARIAANPDAYVDFTLLGEAFVRKARETGDVSWYERARRSLREALEISPGYVPAQGALAGVLVAAHEFAAARELALRASRSPKGRAALAALGDAELALGNVEDAAGAYAEFAGPEREPAAVVRLAALTEVRGDVDGALGLAREAAALAHAAGETGESLAWYELQAGELLFRYGAIDAAEARYRASLAAFPGYHLAVAGLARVAAARDDLDDAIDLYERAAASVPLPATLAALGDLYTLTGQTERAEEQYQLVEAIGKLAAFDRQVFNRELVTFLADHERNVSQAVDLALAELEVRQDVLGYDTAGWALYRAGRLDEARRASDQALAFGTQHPGVLYHAGMIAAAQGRTSDASALLGRALELNPDFDPLQARSARAALEALGA